MLQIARNRENNISFFGLNLLIKEPTHILTSYYSTLFFIIQRNLVTESGVHFSLNWNYHHQVVYGSNMKITILHRAKVKVSVIRQKSKSQNGGNKKTKHAKFFQKRIFLAPFLFSENLMCFVFLLPAFWDSPFCLITNATYGIMQKRILIWNRQ